MRSLVKIIFFVAAAIVFLNLAAFGPGSDLSMNIINEKPEFYVLEWEEGTELKPQKTGIVFEVDSIGQHEVVLLVDKNNRPKLFASDVSTPVCADGECKLMHIKLYWTLLGEYAGFDRYPGLPLTKHDHDLFVMEDYQKLHRLLLDDKSILERRSIDRLVEKPKMRKVNGVDALSGATVKEVKESVVSGALYSCYVAWHLVHGNIQDSIKEHTKTLVDTEMIMGMLKSNNKDYQLFSLNSMNEDQYVENFERIAEIFKTGIPMVRGFVVKNLPESFWAVESLQNPFWEAFVDIDLNSRSFLLQHLKSAPDSAILKIANNLGVMSKNQLKAYLEHLENGKEISTVLKKTLQTFAQSEKQTYSYLVEQFLEDL